MVARLLFPPLITAALTLAAASSSASADDAKARALCLELTNFALGANARAGKWLDRVTRHDGMAVACEDKKVELKRFVSVAVKEDHDEWKERQELEFKTASCGHELSRRAMEEGWDVLATFTMASGENVSLSAECD
jgi:hypothetical protein